MSTLHVLSHSPFSDTRLASCLRLVGPDDGLLLTGDAVYALQAGTEPQARLAGVRLRLYALLEDLQARNLSLAATAEAIDYARFVQLSLEYDKVNTWL
jgi:tRNA 2-thiouridine synthesizing protein B